jgi:hypothetical protein
VVNQWNFWGGPTFVRNHGYVDLDNHGEIRHLRCEEGHERLEWLEWLDRHGDRIALELRLIGEPEIDPAAAAWYLETDIENTAKRELRIGSPTPKGGRLPVMPVSRGEAPKSFATRGWSSTTVRARKRRWATDRTGSGRWVPE